MKNADLPAMPLSGDAYEDISGSSYAPGRYEDGMGLTKREYFAGLAMAAMASNTELPDAVVAAYACNLADARLAELDKEAT